MIHSGKRKILLITLRADHGGGPFHVNQLIEYLKNEFDIFCAAPLDKPYGGLWCSALTEEKFFTLPHRKFSIKHLLKLNSFVKNHQISIVHSHGKGAGIYSRLLKLINGSIKIIHSFHGFHPYTNRISDKVYLIFEKIFNRLTYQFINVSNGERNLCLKQKVVNEANSKVIYNGIQKHKLINVDRYFLRAKLSLPKYKFIILSVNRFDPHKNLIFLVELAKKLNDAKDFLLLLVGDGEERSLLQQKSKELKLTNIIFTGFKENTLEYMSASDIYISASKGEGLSYSMIEAQMAGTTVVASNVVGNNEIIENGVNGLLFDFNNLEMAADLIKRIYKNPEEAKYLVENGYNKFNENFQLENMIAKLKDIYLSIPV